MLTRTQCLAVAVFLVVGLVAAPAWAAPGDLDPSFGEGGHVVVQTNVGCQRRVCVEFGGSYADAVALQPDGGIILGGYENNIGAPRPSSGEVPGALVRLWPSGALDTSFGTEGIEDTPFSVDQIDTNAIGGLAVMGTTETGELGVARYTSSGVLDGSVAPQGVRWIRQPTDWQEDQRDAQGRIVVLTGFKRTTVGVVRYQPSGALDPHFGRGGYASVHVPETPREAATAPGFLLPPEVSPTALALQPSGGVLVAFAVASYEPSGSSVYGKPRYFLERLTPGGRLDRAFGNDGTISLLRAVRTMAVAPNGHILLASAELAERLQVPGEPRRLRLGLGSGRLLLANYTPMGRLDRVFGHDGVARSRPIDSRNQVGIGPSAIAFDSKGDTILVGELPKRTVDVPSGTGFLARYTANGLDCSFGSNGVAIDDEIGGASTVAVEPNGRIIVAGWSRNAFMAARYMGGGTPHTCKHEAATR